MDSQNTSQEQNGAPEGKQRKRSAWGAYAKLPIILIFAWIISAIVYVSANAVINNFFDLHSLTQLSIPFALVTVAETVLMYGSGAFVVGTLTTRINKWLATVLFGGPMFVLQLLLIFGVTDVSFAEQIQRNSREIMQLVCLVLNPVISYLAIQRGRESEFADEPSKILGIAWQHWLWILPFGLYQSVSVVLFLLLLLWKIDFVIGEPSLFELPGMIARIVVFMILSGVLTAIAVAWGALSDTKKPFTPRILKVIGVWLLVTVLEVAVLLVTATKNASDTLEHHKEALKHFDEVIALDPKNPESHLLKGREYAAHEFTMNDRELPNAIEEFTKAIDIDPKGIAGYIARGQAYKTSEKWNEAAADFSKAISIAPDDPTPYVERAEVLKELDQSDRAESDYNKALTLEPHDAEGYFQRANAYLHKKEPTKALADVRAAIKLDSNDGRFYVIRAVCHQNLGDTKKAVADGVAAASCIPREEQTFREQGMEAYKETAYERATSFLTHAIALEPKNPESYFYRAKSYAKLGNKVASEQDFEKAASMDKKYDKQNRD